MTAAGIGFHLANGYMRVARRPAFSGCVYIHDELNEWLRSVAITDLRGKLG